MLFTLIWNVIAYFYRPIKKVSKNLPKNKFYDLEKIQRRGDPITHYGSG